MIYTTKQLINRLGNEARLIKLVEEKKIFKVGFGIYSDTEYDIADLEKLFIRYKESTLTNESAFSFYGLTDLIPEKYTIATGNKSRRIDSNIVKQIYMDEQFLKIGRKKVATEYGHIYIYDKERMLIELFRLKAKFAPELFAEVVKSYRELVINNELDTYKITKYCEKITYGSSILKRIVECVL